MEQEIEVVLVFGVHSPLEASANSVFFLLLLTQLLVPLPFQPEEEEKEAEEEQEKDGRDRETFKKRNDAMDPQ